MSKAWQPHLVKMIDMGVVCHFLLSRVIATEAGCTGSSTTEGRLE